MRNIPLGLLVCTLLCAGPAALAAAPPAAGGGEMNAVEKRSAAEWVGKTAAPFQLQGIDGKIVDAGRVLGKRPVVLVFYRGNW